MSKRDSKYAPLHAFLLADRRGGVVLSLEEIEDILGFTLAASAEKAGWWVNATAIRARAQTWAWIEAGYSASLQRGYVTFRKLDPMSGDVAARH